MEIDLDGDKTCLSAKSLQLFFEEVIDAHSVIFAVEVVLQLAVALAREIQLAEVVPAVVSEKEEASRLHRGAHFLHDLQVLFGGDGR